MRAEHIQAAFEALGEQRRRDAVNMRLGQLIEALEKIDEKDTPILSLSGYSVGEFVSYRGYYEDLALTPASAHSGWCTVDQLLTMAKASCGDTFTGWKGGDYTMDGDSVIWLSPAGEAAGVALISVEKIGYHCLLRGELLDT